MYKIDAKKCADCGYCSFVCPFGAIIHHVDEKYYEIDQEKCKQCGICYKNCITSAIDASEDQTMIKSIKITKDCIGCSLCSRNCPAEAISGVLKEKFKINEDLCLKCGVCAAKCPKKAIAVETMPATKGGK